MATPPLAAISATAATGAPTAAHASALQLLTHLHHLNRLSRSLNRRAWVQRGARAARQESYLGRSSLRDQFMLYRTDRAHAAHILTRPTATGLTIIEHRDVTAFSQQQSSSTTSTAVAGGDGWSRRAMVSQPRCQAAPRATRKRSSNGLAHRPPNRPLSLRRSWPSATTAAFASPQ